MSAAVILACDQARCGTQLRVPQARVQDARKVARERGWLVGIHGWRAGVDGRLRLDYCPAHAGAARLRVVAQVRA